MSKDTRCDSCRGTGLMREGFAGKVTEPGATCLMCHGYGFDTDSDSKIICPYCGDISDPDDMNESKNTQCYSCDKMFWAEVSYSADYSTRRVDCLNDENLHRWENLLWQEPKDGKVYARCRAGCRQYRWVEQSLAIKEEENEKEKT